MCRATVDACFAAISGNASLFPKNFASVVQ